jgi:hypothetical protein
VQRIRNKFSTLFDDLMRVQLITKGICTEEEWKKYKEDIYYDFKTDNNFNELKEAELLQNRVAILQLVDPFVGRYFSKEWVRKNVLQMDEEEITEIDKQIEKEGINNVPTDAMGNPMPTDAMGNPLPVDAMGNPMQQPEMPQSNVIPPTPQEEVQNGLNRDQTDPLAQPARKRFVNDTMEPLR